MNSYLSWPNQTHRRLVSLPFVEDVLGLAIKTEELQKLLSDSASWDTVSKIKWAVEKSCDLQLAELVSLDGKLLPDIQEADYLGVSISRSGITDTRNLSLIYGERRMPHKNRTFTRKWNTNLGKLRTFLKTFVLSHTDYTLYLQPISTKTQGYIGTSRPLMYQIYFWLRSRSKTLPTWLFGSKHTVPRGKAERSDDQQNSEVLWACTEPRMLSARRHKLETNIDL